MKKTKTSLLHSGLVLLLCISMLIGSTFAWFSDSISSGKNIITAGNLDLEMYWTDDLDSGKWHNVEENGHNTIFNYDNWEPGYTDVKYIKLVNAGDLALNYKLSLTPQNGVGKLAEVINVYFAEGGVAVEQHSDLQSLQAIGLLNNVLNGGATADGTLLAADQYSPLHPSGEVIMTVAMNMLTTAGNDYMNEDAGKFTITALATQAPFEMDSFGSDYDVNATFSTILTSGTASADVTPVDGKVPEGGVTLSGSNISAFVPEGVALNDGVNELTLTVTPLKNTTSDISIVNDEILIPVDVHIAGVAEDNSVPIIIDLGEILPKYLNMGNYRLFHVEDGTNNEMIMVDNKADLTAHNQFTYNSNTGAVSVAMASFSEVALLADINNPWQGGYNADWYNITDKSFTITNADELYAFAKIVGGMADGIKKDNFDEKTVNLIQNINLGGGKASVEGKTKVFYPIGYYNTVNGESSGIYDRDDAVVEGMTGVSSNVSSFSGIFNGNGHTISNFYQNTWEMFGDYNSGYTGTPNYYKDAMGLFGYVNGGSVENLTVDSFDSDGEFTPTGVIAAYAADATFKNIAITNCNPRVYNTGNGGIVGVGGNSDDTSANKLVFTNVTVDKTNTISALWGSWDVACGGIMGMFRGYSKVNFTNCHVAAQIDVYNDVCGNYQYYWYRYAGMMIGSLRARNIEKDGYTVPDLSGITADGCSVSFDEWNDYYYCELVDNSIASYTHDHQFSRLEKVYSVDATNMTYKAAADSVETAIPIEGKYNFVTLNGGYETENATCYHFVDGKVWNHEDAGFEDFDLDGNGEFDDYKEDHKHIYLPFNQIFQGDGWGVKHIAIVGDEETDNLNQSTDSQGNLLYPDLDIQILNRNYETKFKVLDEISSKDFLFRVGNGNEFPVGKLFESVENANINESGVFVSVTSMVEGVEIIGSFSLNESDWTASTLKISGTGPAKITIQDYSMCTPTELLVEVVDGNNATTATSATANNVVLLNNCGFSSLTVSNGYALYGNGFTMTCSSDSSSTSFGEFISLESGTLDNVQIVCPNYDYAALYNSQLKDADANRVDTSTSTTRYYNAKSAVSASGNSQILNSRISGGRAALYASSGNIVIDNSRIELGAVANILVSGANSLVLRDTTLIQKPTVSTYDSNKTLMGLSVLYLCDADGNATLTTLEGNFVQYAWADESCSAYLPEGTDSIMTEVLSKDAYVHTVNEKNCVNLGFAYMPNDGTTVNKPTNISDKRTGVSSIPYAYESVNATVNSSGFNVNVSTYVYTYKNTNGNSFATETQYKSDKYSDIISVSYSDNAEGLTFSKSYGTNGWIYEMNVNLDTANGYAVDFSKLSMSVNGVTVTDFKVNGADKPTSPITVVAGGTTYILTATVNGSEYVATYKVTGTETSKDAPSLVSSAYESCLLVGEKGTSTTWSGAAPALQGITIRYYSVAEKDYKEIILSSLTPTTSGQQNGANAYWEYSASNGDYSLTITNTVAVHSGKSIYAMPVVCDSKLYFVITSSDGLVSTSSGSRSITLKYVFKDNNGGELEFTNTFSVEYDSSATLYDYSDFRSGELSQASGCVTPDTLVTLADGTQKEIQYVTYDDQLLVWNFSTGAYDIKPASALINHGEGLYTVIALNFSDGTTVKVIDEHGFFNVDTNKFVFINENNAGNYVGHCFAKADDCGFDSVVLESYSVTKEYTTAYSILSHEYDNALVEGMLSLTPVPSVDNEAFYGCMVIGENMTYDNEAIQAYIAKHGLYTYDELAGYGITYEQYAGANLPYLKIMVGEGIVTLEQALDIVLGYVYR